MSTFPFHRLIRAADLLAASPGAEVAGGWTLEALRGRLAELCGGEKGAALSLACSLVRQAQAEGALSAWVSAVPDSFFPPDVAANGVRLEELPVVWTPDAPAAGNAADWLLRSGAFSLLVIDLGDQSLPMAVQARLVQLARRHGGAVLLLVDKQGAVASQSSLVSLRVQGVRRRLSSGRFRCELRVLKDKRRGPGWRHEEEYGGPPGLC